MNLPKLNTIGANTAKCLTLFTALTVSSVYAELVITFAGTPGSAVTPIANASTFDFNSLVGSTTPSNVIWQDGGTTIATFNKLSIRYATEYGGANNSNFAVNSTEGFGKVGSTSINFTAPVAYFGFWWSAGDATNVLQFFKGQELLFSFTTASLLEELAELPAYSGNPFAPYVGMNSAEKYAYLNFFGQSGSTWDRIVMTNIGKTGFEYDNLAVRDTEWDTSTEGEFPGIRYETLTPVPEPSGTVALGALLGSSAFLRSRRRK